MDNETQKHILKVSDLSVKFGDKTVLENINFNVERGDTIAIVGPNGAGKTQLFRALIGLTPYSGDIDWTPNIKISYVPQRLSIDRELPLSVEEFFKFKTNDPKEIIEALTLVGLADDNLLKTKSHLDKHILKQRMGWLSGGQLQRVMIAWSTLDNPDIFLFDEPTTGIDIGGEETIYNLLKRMKEQKKFTMMIISHDLNIVYKYTDNVVCLNKEMICYGPPSQVLDPEALVKLYGGEATFYQHKHE